MVDKKDPNAKSEYELREDVGKHQLENGEYAVAGDKVPLTDAQYEAFKDKFYPKGRTARKKQDDGVEEGTDDATKNLTATQPQQTDNSKDNQQVKAGEGANTGGAGAAVNSTNTAKVTK